MIIRPIASSSKGNAYLVEHEGASLLIDCGVCYKKVKDFAFDSVLITHNHYDHVSGLKVLTNQRDVTIFANQMTAEATQAQTLVEEEKFACFENGQTFEIGPFEITPFSIPHDAADPVGYLIKAGGEVYFHGTDIGTPLDSIGEKLSEADYATLESNHDPIMLQTSGRPRELKERISGPHGHLSNFEAAELVKKYCKAAKLKKLYLAHLSGECNAPHLAENCMKTALQEAGLKDVELEIIG